ncbi:hypothetical protein PILCRDRAFT_14040 [Piloderma croceum F 1598]|uniref:Uncharacterized protein n=1 Tax=Piloderma croceum (strain F 1598) TaxID=765440 RepID=A0A0C3BC09_PILCF|nr:hypothetical protein PILCRDRAFT_14040 [Piloderma croceum F 1598]
MPTAHVGNKPPQPQPTTLNPPSPPSMTTTATIHIATIARSPSQQQWVHAQQHRTMTNDDVAAAAAAPPLLPLPPTPLPPTPIHCQTTATAMPPRHHYHHPPSPDLDRRQTTMTTMVTTVHHAHPLTPLTAAAAALPPLPRSLSNDTNNNTVAAATPLLLSPLTLTLPRSPTMMVSTPYPPLTIPTNSGSSSPTAVTTPAATVTAAAPLPLPPPPPTSTVSTPCPPRHCYHPSSNSSSSSPTAMTTTTSYLNAAAAAAPPLLPPLTLSKKKSQLQKMAPTTRSAKQETHSSKTAKASKQAKGTKKSSVQRVQQDMAADQAGPPTQQSRTERALNKSGISVAPPPRELGVKDDENSESDDSSDGSEDEVEGESEDKVEDEDDSKKVEIEIEDDGFVDPAGPVGSAGSGPIFAGPAGTAGPTFATPVGCAGLGPAGPLVPAITILPATPMKNKGKSQGNPDDNQEDAPDLDPDSLMGNYDQYKLKRGRERSGTGDAKGIKTHCRSTSHSTAPTMPSTEDEVDEDDVVDENMNPKSSVGSIYIKSSGSGSGSAASSYAAPSDTAEGVTSDSKSIILGPLQQTLIETFNIPTHLVKREKVADLRVTYAKFMDIQRVITGEIAEIYMSRSGYFNCLNKYFLRVIVIPGMLQWLENKEGAPLQVDVWGDKKPYFMNLSDMLDLHEGKKKKKVTKGKGKKQVELSSHSEEEVVKGKGKGKAKAKKAKGVARRHLAPANLVRMMISK